ncbi:uncharacterized protein LOC124909705 [Impatiens glandulifera]|uniref:uncharacterized protein LOC124909705 n=1 Tax=Impatiens glandulifera TaxID=253017 RepID=UPI001FB095D4|nr:uncharacterized protein LOC124909705 [Impatiens glandulifera]
MAMRESKDLNKLELHDLFADLKAYEFEINSRNEENPSKFVTTKVLVTTKEPSTSASAKSVEQICDDAMSLFVKKFDNFMRKNHSNFNSNRNNLKNESKANLKCFNCDKLGHFKADCRKPKRDDKKSFDTKNRKDQKALLAEESKSKWIDSDSDESSSCDSEDEGVKCFMANDNETMQVAKLIGKALMERVSSLVKDFGIQADESPIFRDNINAITITSNTANAASGTAVEDDCKIKFGELKAKRIYRFIVFKIEGQTVVVEKLGGPKEDYDNFTASLPTDECRYAVFDFDYTTDENVQKSKIIFVAWSPESSKVRMKMVYASSKDRFKRELDGIQVELQATDPSEMSFDIIKGRAL